MSSVDPFESPPVYEAEQVLTQADLRLWMLVFDKFEMLFIQQNDMPLADACHIGHVLLEELQNWIKDGKPEAIDGDDLFYKRLG